VIDLKSDFGLIPVPEASLTLDLDGSPIPRLSNDRAGSNFFPFPKVGAGEPTSPTPSREVDAFLAISTPPAGMAGDPRTRLDAFLVIVLRGGGNGRSGIEGFRDRF